MGKLKESWKLQNPLVTFSYLPASACKHWLKTPAGALSPQPNSTQGHCASTSPPPALPTPHSPLDMMNTLVPLSSCKTKHPNPNHPYFPLQLPLHLSTPLHNKIPWKRAYTSCFWSLSSHLSQAFLLTEWSCSWQDYPQCHVAKLNGPF